MAGRQFALLVPEVVHTMDEATRTSSIGVGKEHARAVIGSSCAAGDSCGPHSKSDKSQFTGTAWLQRTAMPWRYQASA
jgi:hypothetical protein